MSHFSVITILPADIEHSHREEGRNRKELAVYCCDEDRDHHHQRDGLHDATDVTADGSSVYNHLRIVEDCSQAESVRIVRCVVLVMTENVGHFRGGSGSGVHRQQVSLFDTSLASGGDG